MSQASGELTERQSRLLLVGLTVYVLVLVVLAADQILELGIIRPELDRDLIGRIETLNAGPPALPVQELAALRQAAAGLARPEADPRVVETALDIHDMAYGFGVGSPPDSDGLKGLAERIEQVRKAQPPAADAGTIAELDRLSKALGELVSKLAPENAKALADRHATVEYVINYHEFSIPHLIRALRKAQPPGRAAAAYCLHQIAWRFFRYRAPEGAGADGWSAWWRKTEADMERRSRR